MRQRWKSLLVLSLTVLQVSASPYPLGIDQRLSPPSPSTTQDWEQHPTHIPRNDPTPTAKVITSFAAAGTIQILASKKTPPSGFVHSVLEKAGHVTSFPLLTSPIPKPTSLLSALPNLPSLEPALPPIAIKMLAQDIFADPISTDPPPANIAKRGDHPVPRLGIQKSGPIETNKFYGNFHLGNQTSPTYLHPYSVAWPRGQGPSASWGLAVSHVERTQTVYGQVQPATGAAAYFLNPIGIHSVCISAVELNSSTTTLTTSLLTDFSVQVNLLSTPQSPSPAIQFPLVQGAAFVTALFNGATPLIQTGVFYRTVTRTTREVKPGVTKYKLHLEDGITWLLYARHTQGDPLDLQVINNGLAQASGPFYGSIQVAKDPGNGEGVYDAACGVWATGVEMSGCVDGGRGEYTFSFKKGGDAGTTLAMFALPHHQASFDDATKGKMTDVKLQTTTKGVAVAVVADKWTMVEGSLPVNMGFSPWSPQAGSVATISNETRAAIHEVARQEVSQNMQEQTNQDSMYFSGKVS